MPSLKSILVVDDSVINRKVLAKILSAEYCVIEAENGEVALDLLAEHGDIAAVMLDLVMPIKNGYEVLEALQNDSQYTNLPIIVTTDSGNSDSEIMALTLGAWDFVSKPFNAEIIKFRLKNAIARSQLSALKQLRYLSEYDALTGIFNKTKFFNSTREMLDANPNEKFVFMRFDVDRFQLINSFFGTDEGDRLLIYIAQNLEKDAMMVEHATYGRIESDVVGFCMPYDKALLEEVVHRSKKTLAKYNPNYDIVPSIGLYIINDPKISVEEMYNRATLAAKTCKGNYVDFYAYYNESMSAALTVEQEITNDMNFALENGQFEVYLQPKYNIHTNSPCGAEALVRWRHPKRGLLAPSAFLPVFERNGFITKLDYYVWEETCKCLSKWKKQGISTYPISVNVSRVNVYNPKLAETLLELVRKYDLAPGMLSLELTESAYTDNPIAMKKAMQQLQGYGFVILMDDFGSGYSSLSLLKDIAIDILKIDMRFLTETEMPGRGENIIASVIRMAKWLNIPVIAEGAETREQVDFLRSVGCDYVQGYFFAKPMPVAEYEKLCINSTSNMPMLMNSKGENYRYDDLFASNRDMKLLFSNSLTPAVIYEFADDNIEMIRVNEAYYALLGHEDMLARASYCLNMVAEEFRHDVINAFRQCAETKGIAECEFKQNSHANTPLWINAKLRYATMVGSKYVIIGELTDITMRKELNYELQKYKQTWLMRSRETQTVLIVDDAAVNRAILKRILRDKFNFLEAANGAEALEALQNSQNHIDLILLDISMPIMDGKEFLQHKQNLPQFDSVPVIMISADDSPEQQISTFSLGANDYIIKPFIAEVVTRRVKNVLESNKRFKEMVQEYNNMSEQIKTDLMTGLINRVSAENMISQRLKSSDKTCAMFMLDIDNFKKINDTKGHDYGDKVICAVANNLRTLFRSEDIVARMGGDEFAVFMSDIPNEEVALNKAYQLCKSMASITIEGKIQDITCSVGIAVSSSEINSFQELYQNSDKALYNAKCGGRNTVSVYGGNVDDASVEKWINDAESVLAAINDSIYVCDRDTYELLYANDNLCKYMGVSEQFCKGKKCYEVLMNKTQPCDFCPIAKISEEKVYTRLFKMPNRPQLFLMRGRNVKRNGTMLHLEVAVDVTQVDNMELYNKGAAADEQQPGN